MFHTHHWDIWKSYRPKPILVHHNLGSSLLDQEGKSSILFQLMKSQFFFFFLSLLHFGSQCTLIKYILVSFFPFWPQFPYVLFIWSTELPQGVLAVTELNSFCKNESLSNRNLNYDRWNWDIRIVLNLNLAKAWSLLGLLSRGIFHSLLHCCYKTSLILPSPSRQGSWREALRISIMVGQVLCWWWFTSLPSVDNWIKDRQSFSILHYFKLGEMSFCYWAQGKWNPWTSHL